MAMKRGTEGIAYAYGEGEDGVCWERIGGSGELEDDDGYHQLL